jgi:phosphoglycerate dehydrogenase-like enzyme
MALTVLVRDELGVEVLGHVAGVDVLRYQDANQPPDGAETAEVLVVESDSVDDQLRLMTRLPQLRLVQTLSAGVERWEGRLPDGVALSNARGAHGGATAEWAMAALLAVLRELPLFVVAQTERRWEPETTDTLDGKSVVVLGAGDLGVEFRRRAEPFGAAVTLVARSAREGVRPMADLDEVLPSCDALVVMLPLTDETRKIVDADLLRKLPDRSVVVNAGRGPLVDTDALLAELRSGRLRAALDVTDPEPLPTDHPLWSAPNLLLTPHVGGNTEGYQRRAWQVAAEQIEQFAGGQEPSNLQS